MYELIRGINSPADIKRMNKEDLSNLAKDIRKEDISHRWPPGI